MIEARRITWRNYAATMDKVEKLTENLRSRTHFSNLNVDTGMMLN
jgi:hypothetical protein